MGGSGSLTFQLPLSGLRGYWHPYELELYRRLKELLMLTDADAVRLMRLKLPEKTEEVMGAD